MTPPTMATEEVKRNENEKHRKIKMWAHATKKDALKILHR